MNKQTIGLVGLIGSGKNTVANILVKDHGFEMLSFAGALKDAVSAIFGWPRNLLEGDTTESRKFRETVDEFWQKSIGNISLFEGKPVTPRLVLQLMGTEIMRTHFHTDIWVISVIKKIQASPDKSFVISDVRFQNEINLLKNINGAIIRIKRGEDPKWFETAANNQEAMPLNYPDIHRSEWDWVPYKPSFIIENDGSLEDLRNQVNTWFKE